jgi:hypothetical protein
LTARLNWSLESSRLIYAIAIADILALLQYLHTGRNLSAALKSYAYSSDLLTQHLTRSSSGNKSIGTRDKVKSSARLLGPSSKVDVKYKSPYHELLHQSQARLIHYHIRRGIKSSYRPAEVRDTLNQSLTLFPNNTIFLYLYTYNEARFRVDDRVRSLVRNLVLQNRQETIIGWMFSVHHEFSRTTYLQGASGNTNSVQAIFESAITSSTGKHSVSLWMWYVHFMIDNFGETRAKDTFLRGLRHVPWAKSYYLLAFGTRLSKVLRSGQLKGIYRLMAEKGLRIRVQLDEVLNE